MFSEKVNEELSAKLDPSNVKERVQGNTKLSYVEGWHVIAEANRIFGFDGWQRETVEVKCVNERERTIGSGQYQKQGWGVTYTARVRVSVLDREDGIYRQIEREGTGAGHGIDADLGKAHESAIKEAETDAMKRAFMTFGNPFGLALYDKTQSGVGETDKPEPKTSKANVKLVSEINQLTNPMAAKKWWHDNEREILTLSEEQQQEVDQQFQNKLKRLEAGDTVPGSWKWANVAEQDAWLEKARGVFDRCDTGAEIDAKQAEVQHKITALETGRRMKLVDKINIRRGEISTARKATEVTKAG